MSLTAGKQLLLTSAAGSSAYQISRSLRFNAGDSAFCSRSVTAGNQKTWSLSFWLKRAALGTDQEIFATANGDLVGFVRLTSGNLIRVFSRNASAVTQYDVSTVAVLRDCSAWYHILVVQDTTQAASGDRIKIYINGTLQTLTTATTASLNTDCAINTSNTHNIGNQPGASVYLSAYLAECYLIDGQALDPSSFTTTDLTTGQLIPKAYTGTYGLVSVADATGALPIYNTTGTYGTAKGSGTRTDSNSSSIVLAIPMDGANNGTTFTDESATIKGSGSAKTLNRNGDTKTVTSVSKFYGSSAFFDGTGDFLQVTPRADFEPTGNTPFSFEAWIYPTTYGRTIFGTYYNTGSVGAGGEQGFLFILETDGKIYVPMRQSFSGGNVIPATTTTVPLNKWTHLAIQIGAQTDIYFDGILQPITVSYFGTTGPADGSRNPITSYNASATTYIGANNQIGTPSSFFAGYIQDLRVYNGVRKYTSNFSPVLSYNNSFQLKFADNSSNTATTLGKDTSGNSNNWTPNNLSVTAGAGNDSLVDTPTSYGTDTGVGGEVRGNYATLNPLDSGSSSTLVISNGNLEAAQSTGLSVYRCGPSTVIPNSGKYYAEFVMSSIGTGSNVGVGVIEANHTRDTYAGGSSNGVGYLNDGRIFINSSNTTNFNTFTTTDVIGVAVDYATGKVWFAKNNTWQNSGDPVAGTNAVTTLNPANSMAICGTTARGSGASGTTSFVANFGQRAFAYTAPSGFKALCDTNLPAPVVAKPNTVMDVKLYTGNGSTQTISGLGFSPDFVWIKGRNDVYWHELNDAVRGAGKSLFSNATNAEGTINTLTSFNSDGFTVAIGSGGQEGTNASSKTYAAWCWDAGTSTVSNTAGSITSQVRANASAGFSVVTYTGSSGTNTIGHGLGVAPALIINKRRDSAENWYVYHSALGSGNYLILNAGNASAALSWGGAPTSTVFYNSTSSFMTNGGTYVAYCFAPVSGYSSFGSYTGNGSTDGPFVFCNFRPRWIMVKQSSASGEGWWIRDAARNTYNTVESMLAANASGAEISSSGYAIDFLSNGFKLRNSNPDANASGATYIYAAFAENPFQYSRAR